MRSVIDWTTYSIPLVFIVYTFAEPVAKLDLSISQQLVLGLCLGPLYYATFTTIENQCKAN